jgi:hypothetical protein
MLRSMPASLLEEWKAFFTLDPDLIERSDMNFAHLVQVSLRSGKPLSDFVLPFGDRRPPKVVQDIKTQEMLIDAWIIGSNAQFQNRRTVNA